MGSGFRQTPQNAFEHLEYSINDEEKHDSSPSLASRFRESSFPLEKQVLSFAGVRTASHLDNDEVVGERFFVSSEQVTSL